MTIEELRNEIYSYIQALQDADVCYYVHPKRGDCPSTIMCYRGGFFIALNLKLPKTKKYYSDLKKDSLEKIDKVGGLVWEITSLDGLKQKLEKLDDLIDEYDE